MPTEKSKAVEDILTDMTGISRLVASELGVCTWCKAYIRGFRDTLSRREYEISGLCQECQDKTFGVEEKYLPVNNWPNGEI